MKILDLLLNKKLFSRVIATLIAIFLVIDPLWVASARSSREESIPPKIDADSDKENSERYDQWHKPVRIDSVSPLSAPLVDRFGYKISTSTPFSWVNANTGTEIFQEGDRDDNYSEPIDIGFDFDFYEHTYNQLYVSTNGFLSFGTGSESFSNRSIPEDTPPNNLIAPFWDDLDISDGHVFFKSRNIGDERSLVIEWEQVLLYGSNDHLSFEIILFESGDILFQYLNLQGLLNESTVGIEDGDGVDGLLYLYNSSGLSEGTTVRFIRPGPAPRLKVLPLYQSNFAVNRHAEFQITVTNTNEVGTDTYNLASTLSHPGWSVNYSYADSNTALIDTNGDGQPDTGSIPHGNTRSILVSVFAPTYPQVGHFTKLSIQLASSKNSSKSQEVIIQVAIPAAYAQAYADSASGVFLGLSSRFRNSNILVDRFFTGNTLSVAATDQGQFIYTWERNGEKSVGGEVAYYSNIEYAILDRFGDKIRGADSLTNNEALASPSLLVNARYPALASMPNGLTGILWAQYLLDLTTFSSNSNIYFAILNASGELIAGPLNVTNNDAWGGQGQDDVPMYSSPQIATTDNRFFLSWSEVKQTVAGESSDLLFAIYSANGSLVKSPHTFITNEPGITQNIDPRLTGISDERILMTYSIYNQTEQTYSIAYAILNNNGGTARPATTIPDSSGWRMDAEQFPNGNILIAWTNPATDKMAFVILNSAGSEILSQPKDLSLLVNRLPDYVSVTISEDGDGVVTWMDAEWKDYLFYALISESGQVKTPPMISKKGQSDNPLIQTSFTGHGLATYVVHWRNYMPVIRR
jgi:hypothetical protein